MRIPLPLLLAALALGACAGAEKRPAPPEPPLIQIGSSQRLWTGVAASGDRIWVNFPRRDRSVSTSVAELVEGRVVPWPNEAWNAWTPNDSGEEQFVAVQSVWADDRGSLWVVDTGNPLQEGVIGRGPRLFRFATQTGELYRAYSFPREAWGPDSYYNDVRVDHRTGTAYLTDSSEGGIVVLDLKSGAARKVLADHPSTLAETDALQIDGATFLREVHADGLALTPDGKWLFYAPLTGHTLWRVPTEALRDPAADPAARVEKIREIVATDGMAMAPNGNLFLGGLEESAIYVLRPDGSYDRLIRDERLSWPDSLAFDGNGDLLVTTTHLHLREDQRPSYGLWRIDLR